MATVLITPAAKAQFLALPLTIKVRVAMIFERLERWPAVSGAKPLRGNLAGQYRVRTGDYRVQFKVSGSGPPVILTILRVGHRDGFYE